jgi:RNA recognition motif-containing protein
MSLFIGNISNSVKIEELQTLFEEYGPCKIKLKTSFAFVDYEKERDAEEAILHCKGKNLNGRDLKIEWSFRSGKNKREPLKKFKDGCFSCGSKDHKIKDCDKNRGGRNERFRNRRSRSNSRERRNYGRGRSRSRSRSRDEKEHTNNKRKYSSSRSRSHSRSKDNGNKKSSRDRK